MATIVHMIPKELYEQLKDQELPDTKFPSEQKTRIELVIENLPSTLRDKATAILRPLTTDRKLTWNTLGEIQINSKVYPNINITALISALVHGSSNFYNLQASDQLLAIIKTTVPSHLYSESVKVTQDAPQKSQVGKGKTEWITFEERLQF